MEHSYELQERTIKVNFKLQEYNELFIIMITFIINFFIIFDFEIKLWTPAETIEKDLYYRYEDGAKFAFISDYYEYIFFIKCIHFAANVIHLYLWKKLHFPLV
jgi:lipoprotein signal peptidase